MKKLFALVFDLSYVEIKWLDDTAVQTIISGSTLTNNNREAAAYNNSTELDMYADFELFVKFDTTAPSAGDRVAELFILPTVDGTNFPEGGDGTVGDDLDPQQVLKIGVFESRDPSTSTEERIVLSGIPLPPRDARYVIKNISGQTMNASWTLKAKPYKLQSV